MGSSAIRISAQLALGDRGNGDIAMKETIGVRSYVVLFSPQLIKRDALMFRKIGVIECEKLIGIADTLSPETAAELRWLVEQGIVFDLQPQVLFESNSLDDQTKKILDDSAEIIKQYWKSIGQSNFFEELRPYAEKEGLLQGEGLKLFELAAKKPEYLKQWTTVLVAGEFILRPLSAYHRNNKHFDAYPLFNSAFPELAQESASMVDVIDITINQIPIPDDSTSWEQILDFRNDPDTEIKFRRFRAWMNEIARAKLTPKEIEDKLAWLLDEYQQHMKLHRMKTKVVSLETIIVSLAEFAEDLVKLKLGKLAKVPFAIRQRKVALLEGELKSAGREIAFISKAQETFR